VPVAGGGRQAEGEVGEVLVWVLRLSVLGAPAACVVALPANPPQPRSSAHAHPPTHARTRPLPPGLPAGLASTRWRAACLAS
jgi:hypothetical protein